MRTSYKKQRTRMSELAQPKKRNDVVLMSPSPTSKMSHQKLSKSMFPSSPQRSSLTSPPKKMRTKPEAEMSPQKEEKILDPSIPEEREQLEKELEQAMQVINSINKGDLTEMKAFAAPP